MNVDIEKLLFSSAHSLSNASERETLSVSVLVSPSSRQARKTRELLKQALDRDLSEIRTKAVFSFKS